MKNLLFSLFLLIIISSCTSDEEDQRQINSGFQGNWTGVFSGQENGTINFTVEKEGTITGTLLSSLSDIPENFQGYVSYNGKFDINTVSKFYFSGYLDTVKSVEGQWKKNTGNTTISGNFSIHKQ